MLTLNDNVFNQAVTKIGLESRVVYPYKELLTSEISYLNHFLFYLNDEDIESLLRVYEHKKFRLQGNEMTQEQLRSIYNCLKDLRERQKDFMRRLYEPEPQRWLQSLLDLQAYYQPYIKMSLGMVVPAKVNLKFKEIQAVKIKEHHPQLGTLTAVLITPIQRLPRYVLLATEIIKALEKKEEKGQPGNEALTHFRAAMILFLNGANALTRQINTMMEPEEQQPPAPPEQQGSSEDEEPSSPYFQPSGRLHPRVNTYKRSQHEAGFPAMNQDVKHSRPAL